MTQSTFCFDASRSLFALQKPSFSRINCGHFRIRCRLAEHDSLVWYCVTWQLQLQGNPCRHRAADEKMKSIRVKCHIELRQERADVGIVHSDRCG